MESVQLKYALTGRHADRLYGVRLGSFRHCLTFFARFHRLQPDTPAASVLYSPNDRTPGHRWRWSLSRKIKIKGDSNLGTDQGVIKYVRSGILSSKWSFYGI